MSESLCFHWFGVNLKNMHFWGTWMAHLVEHPTFDFSSGHDLRVVGLSPTPSSALSMEPAYDSLSFMGHLGGSVG